MNYGLSIRQRRRRLSVWVLIFAIMAALLSASLSICARAAEYQANEAASLSDTARLSESGNGREMNEKIGGLGIIIAILAAIAIIAVIIFTVRGGR